MVDNEMLLAISNMMDQKFKTNLAPIEKRLDKLESDVSELKSDVSELKSDVSELKSDVSELKSKVKKTNITLENTVCPRLNNIEACYTSTYERYKKDADKIESTVDDVEIIKRVVIVHSEKLEKLLCK